MCAIREGKNELFFACREKKGRKRREKKILKLCIEKAYKKDGYKKAWQEELEKK